jgi:Domain of unknown function (DUF4158)
MPSVSDTAYPRFKINPSAKELNELYTPTVYELAFARERARQPLQRAGLLLLLKTFQRLGYFALCAEIPAPIIRHIFRCAGLVELPEHLQAYDLSTARDRHTTLIREFLGVTAYGPAAREVVVETCLQAARTRDDLPDLINMAIEELIRQRFELPAFLASPMFGAQLAFTARECSLRASNFKCRQQNPNGLLSARSNS